MRFFLRFSMIAVLMAVGSAAAAAPPAPFTLSTTAFADGGQIPVQFTAAAQDVAPGQGVSPPLAWSNPPAGTRSFVLHMHDLDVARNRTTDDQLHWLVWNLPATATGLPQGVPPGSQLAGGAYQISATGATYRGPGAPAAGPPHHYVIELYALDGTIDVQPEADPFATRAQVLAAIQGHVLGKAVYLGLFHRPQ
ncbi:MAG TPA: YbhB/YbcL family Raf kinase inhibitor-like protein [Bryobacteraceae bacterium]|nr:YbhB/YbcL family Raf kinase inhibitor-like protein [Bauldia sp.]HWB86439.1 YbhB/YbcL family Raf kinase inhibitor-like protein [Bryobacteraceae bacterium]